MVAKDDRNSAIPEGKAILWSADTPICYRSLEVIGSHESLIRRFPDGGYHGNTRNWSDINESLAHLGFPWETLCGPKHERVPDKSMTEEGRNKRRRAARIKGIIATIQEHWIRAYRNQC